MCRLVEEQSRYKRTIISESINIFVYNILLVMYILTIMYIYQSICNEMKGERINSVE